MTGAERQRRYMRRLKGRAASITDGTGSPGPIFVTDEAQIRIRELEAEVAELEMLLGEQRVRSERLEVESRRLKAAVASF
jgi:hypothetical protein